jgi:hypothetical protein
MFPDTSDSLMWKRRRGRVAIEYVRDGDLHANVMANVPVPTKSVEAANWRSFDQTVGRLRESFADLRAICDLESQNKSAPSRRIATRLMYGRTIQPHKCHVDDPSL